MPIGHPIRNLFSDKASVIPRNLLREPSRKWVVRDFSGPGGVSLGLAQSVLAAMSQAGYVERRGRGPQGHTLLTQRERLVSDWRTAYDFNQNTIATYYTPDRNIMNSVRRLLREKDYALTMHAGANLLTSFVMTEEVHLYLGAATWARELPELRQRLGLVELKQGGNFHFVRPYYKHSVFLHRQVLSGFKVVSPLQLYLDLYHYQPRGREHAEYLAAHLERKGDLLA